MTIGRCGRSHVSPLNRRALWLGRYLDPHAYTAPPLYDNWTGGTRYNWFGNDTLGVCTYAALAHMFQQRCALLGITCTITPNDVIDAYKAGTGYDGTPGTDQGGSCISALVRTKNVGIGGYRARAFARVNMRDPVEVRAAIHIAGSIYVGGALPRRIASQGRDWKLPMHQEAQDAPGSLGGHAWLLTGYQRGNLFALPWVDEVSIDDAWEDLYIDEGWVVLDDLWATETRLAPNGLDLSRLYHDLTKLGTV